MSEFGLRPVRRKTGVELFHSAGADIGIKLLEFWQWSASNLLSNNLRGHLAEFLVASAAGTAATTRIEWDSSDVLTRKGSRVEVKSAAYVQAWKRKPSDIKFRIGPTKKWDWEMDMFTEEADRFSDYYVFCLLAEKDSEKVDPTDLSQWEFYLVSTAELNTSFPKQKTLPLAALIRMGAKRCTYAELTAELADK